ncbi:hypothetical protein E8L90_13160 [Brevibacillus antibioticus]|uniref:Uncharacterized protein n=1 Tax=Brevibacillus antibioticus TaxID=2570228 RepID=A0A4U2Y714_9BACL|nr:hypothetical protein [Brevibacillus antibioticus]TKI56339.1 hypothetical protein E8L90_13160 [Brevibacillus antibioticus]
MIKKVMTLGVVLSVFTFSSQAVFASEIVQNQKFEQRSNQMQEYRELNKNKGKAASELYNNIYFYYDNLPGNVWIYSQDYTRFKVDYPRPVEFKIDQYGSSPNMEYHVIRGTSGMYPVIFEPKGTGRFVSNAWLEPGEYYFNFKSNSSDLTSFSVEVTQY